MQNSNSATPLNSIRRQLLCWLLIPLVCLCALSSYLAYNLSSSYATEWHDNYLVNSADSIAARLYRNQEGVALVDIPSAAKGILKHNGLDVFYYQVIDSNGHRLTGDANLPFPKMLEATSGPKYRYAELDGKIIRMCRIPVNLGPTTNTIWVQVAETLNSRQRLLRQIFFSILLPQLALVLLASISVWIGIRHGLTPLYKLGAILRRKSNLDFSPIDIGQTPAELSPVIDALNEHFSNTGKFFRAQRQFTGDAAHQLRTPITALTTYVDCARKINENPALTNVLDQMSQVADRTAHIVGRLLALARSEGRIPAAEPVDLVSVISDVASCMIPQALRKNLDLSFDMPQDGVFIMGNRGDLEELIGNLIDNAITYTPEFGAVFLELKQDGQEILLSIEDTGPGIPDDQKEKIFERFYRAAAGSNDGCGLGLSIVSEVAKLFKTKVEVGDSIHGGAKFSVSFRSVQLPAIEQQAAK